MKQATMFLVLIVLALSIAAARQKLEADPPAAEKPALDSPQAPANEPQAPANEEASPLNELDWMAGRWVDNEEDSSVSTTCSWTQNRKFLTQSFRIARDGKPMLEGEQKIGWDPIEKQIRSWIFDSEGGFGEGRWIKDGDRWLVKTTFVLAGGERASSVNVYTHVDADTFRWQSIDREIGGELQPNIPEVTVSRQAAKRQKPKQPVQKAEEGSR